MIFSVEGHCLGTIERHCRTMNKGSNCRFVDTWCDRIIVLKVSFPRWPIEWYPAFYSDVGLSYVTCFGMLTAVMGVEV